MPPTEPDGSSRRFVAIFKVALTLTCPNCGRGGLYERTLKMRRSCSVCKADFTFFDAEDGPALFAIVLLSAVSIGFMAFLEAKFKPPFWLYLVAYPLPMLALAVVLIRHIKAFLFASAWVHGVKTKK